MDQGRTFFVLKALSAVARGQGDAEYDHDAALRNANVTERNEALQPIAEAWRVALPEPYKSLSHYQRTQKPTGKDMEQLFIRAMHILHEKAQEARKNGQS